jgi:hypothetical protein
MPYELAGNNRIWDGVIDMGCYEYGSLPYVDIYDPIAPELSEHITATNYPNPFNPNTTISFFLPQAGKTELVIYNQKGQKVRTLSSSSLGEGPHKLIWDGRSENGTHVASGIYLYRISTNQGSITKKMILAK